MELIVKNISVVDLIPYARNARTHSAEQVAQIAASIREFGFTNPVLVDGENGIIAGHGRVLAAQKLGMDEVPTIALPHLTNTQKKAYILADNKLALNAGWDEEMLALELTELDLEDFNLDLIGFSDDELADFLTGDNDGGSSEGLTDADDVPEEPEIPVTQPGDVWLLGNVTYVCEDCGVEYSPDDAREMKMECSCG